MSFNWKEYVEVAIFLRDCDKGVVCEEAALRSAVSRSYYAAFCYARNYAIREFQYIQPQNKTEDHKKVFEALIQNKRKRAAADLNQLRTWRNQCDYQNSVGNLKSMITNAITKSQQVFKELI